MKIHFKEKINTLCLTYNRDEVRKHQLIMKANHINFLFLFLLSKINLVGKRKPVADDL